MSTQTHGESLAPRHKAGSFALVAALAASAAFTFSTHTASAGLPSTTAAAAAASGTISALLTGSDANFAADAAAAIKTLAEADFSAADDEAIIKAALGTISDTIAGNNPSVATQLTPAQMLAADRAIGAAIAGDAKFTAIAKNGLTTILENGLVGINGVKGKSTGPAPDAAQAFVAGTLVGGVAPNGLTLEVYGVDILAKVSKNTSVVELVTNDLANVDLSSDFVPLAQALIKKYAAANVKIVQGIAAAIPPTSGTTVTNTVTFVQNHTTALNSSAGIIAEGATFVEPGHAEDFTAGAFASLVAGGGSKLATKYAAAIATDEGTVLGSYGDALTDVAQVYAALSGSNILSVKNLGTYAKDLISGAVKSKVPFEQLAFGSVGGTLAVGGKATGYMVGQGVVTDLESIVDQFAKVIFDSNGGNTMTTAGAKAAAAEIKTLVSDVTAFVTKETITNTAISAPVEIAASVANLLDRFCPSGLT